jgi:Na+/H+-dicarboxylate symporter
MKKKLALHWKIIIGMLLGMIWAFVSSFMGWSSFTLNFIDPFGVIFINLLKLIAIPLVLFSIISGVANIGDPANLGRIGVKTLILYLITTFVALTLGLVLVGIIQPGKLIDEQSRIDNRISYELWASTQGHEIKDGLDYLHDPQFTHRIQEIIALTQSTYQESPVTQREPGVLLQPLVDIIPDNFFFSLSEGLMLQVIFFAAFFGVCLVLLPNEKTRTLSSIVDEALEVFMKMIDIIMRAAPFFVFALIAGVVSKMAGDDVGKVFEIFKGLSLYSLTVLLGLLLMMFGLYPLAMKIFVGKIPYVAFFRGMSSAQILAFSTSSSAATLPVTLECVEHNLGVDNKVASFVLPIGATVNMDGTSLYQAVAVIFLAQIHMIELTLVQQLVVVISATLASIGSAAVPSAGLVMLIIVLESVGLNPAWVAIIFPVDRILDMFRTMVNVTGDATVCSIIAQGEGMLNYQPKDLLEVDRDLDEEG